MLDRLSEVAVPGFGGATGREIKAKIVENDLKRLGVDPGIAKAIAQGSRTEKDILADINNSQNRIAAVEASIQAETNRRLEELAQAEREATEAQREAAEANKAALEQQPKIIEANFQALIDKLIQDFANAAGENPLQEPIEQIEKNLQNLKARLTEIQPDLAAVTEQTEAYKRALADLAEIQPDDAKLNTKIQGVFTNLNEEIINSLANLEGQAYADELAGIADESLKGMNTFLRTELDATAKQIQNFTKEIAKLKAEISKTPGGNGSETPGGNGDGRKPRGGQGGSQPTDVFEGVGGGQSGRIARNDKSVELTKEEKATIRAMVTLGMGRADATAITLANRKADKKAAGGLIYANEGMYMSEVFKPQGTDTVPAMLTPGEYVIRKSSVDKYGKGFLDQVNAGTLYAQSGGVVGRLTKEKEERIKNLINEERKLDELGITLTKLRRDRKRGKATQSQVDEARAEYQAQLHSMGRGLAKYDRRKSGKEKERERRAQQSQGAVGVPAGFFDQQGRFAGMPGICLLYTSPSPRD